MTKLTPKQELFVAEYLKDLNASEAARRAGYSAKTAPKIGSENLQKLDVRTAIVNAMNKRMDEIGITQNDVLREVISFAFMDTRAAFDQNGNLLPIHEIPAELARAITGYEVVRSNIGTVKEPEYEYTHKVKFVSKEKMIELLGRHLNMFGTITKVQGEVKHEHSHAHTHTHESVSETDAWLEKFGAETKEDSPPKALSH